MYNVRSLIVNIKLRKTIISSLLKRLILTLEKDVIISYTNYNNFYFLVITRTQWVTYLHKICIKIFYFHTFTYISYSFSKEDLSSEDSTLEKFLNGFEYNQITKVFVVCSFVFTVNFFYLIYIKISLIGTYLLLVTSQK